MFEFINLKCGGKISVTNNWLNDSNDLFKKLQSLEYKSETINMFNKEVQIPRLQLYMADENVVIKTYSNKNANTIRWSDDILKIKHTLESELDDHYNYCLINYYRDGSDYISMHSDKEITDDTKYIPSLSLGATRKFKIKSNDKTHKEDYMLNCGDLVIMDLDMQKYYKHGIMKTKTVVGPRINITFRT